MKPARWRVLVIDDDAVDREAVRRVLRVASIAADVVEAEDGGAAFDALSRERFDCIILDHLLPGTTALELLPEVKAAAPETPVIVLTGHGDERIAVELMKRGAADYLAKDAITAERLGRSLHYATSLGEAKRAIERAEQRQRWATERLRYLVDAAPALYGIHRLDELVKAGAERAQALFDAPVTVVALWPPGAEPLGAIARPGGTVEAPPRTLADDALLNRLSAGGGFSKLSLAEAEPLFRATWPDEPWPADHLLLGTRLVADRRILGYVAILQKLEAPGADHGDVFAAQLGQLLSTAIENTLLHQAKERALRARDDVLAVVSHDLRSPLGNVRLGVALLKELVEDQEAREVIERLENGVTHMTKLVEDLLDMARIDGNQLVLDVKVEAVSAIVEAASKLADAQAGAKRLTFHVDNGAGDARVEVERHRILQVLSNLLGNAIKFTPEGGSVTLSAQATSDEVRVSVRDTGVGIPAEDLPHVFNRFWRRDGKQTRRGLGLGLFIVKGIVEAHGGRVRAESAPGRGSQFTVVLPRVTTALSA